MGRHIDAILCIFVDQQNPAQCQQPTGPRKQPIRTRYLGHVTGYQPVRDLYFLVRSVPAPNQVCSRDILLFLPYQIASVSSRSLSPSLPYRRYLSGRVRKEKESSIK